MSDNSEHATEAVEEKSEIQKAINREKIIVPLLVVVAVSIIVILQYAQQGGGPGLQPGATPPAFELKSLSGETVRLSDYAGKVVFVNFWATYCRTCMEEMPSIYKLHQQYKSKGLEVVAISIDGSLEPVKELVKQTGWDFTILHDPTAGVAVEYRTTGVPETFIIGPDGKVLYYYLGPRDWYTEDIHQNLAEWLKDVRSAG